MQQTVYSWLLLIFHWKLCFLGVKVLLNVFKPGGNDKESNFVYRKVGDAYKRYEKGAYVFTEIKKVNLS